MKVDTMEQTQPLGTTFKNIPTALESKSLIDDYGRCMKKLRVSLLEACNFRCFYCMPEGTQFLKNNNNLSVNEIFKIVRSMTHFGVDEVRLTGGEPLLRKDFKEIVLKLSELPLKKLGLTTNAFHLEKELDFIKYTRLNSLNISLDSLNSKNFSLITKRDGFHKVMSAIEKAQKLNFQVKLNMVLLRGVNDSEILDFVNFSKETGIEVRFLEVMKIGQAYNKNKHIFISAQEVIDTIKQKEQLTSVPTEKDSTSFKYRTSSGAKIGFIASESKSFCGSCSRLRLSPQGFLRACLMKEDGLSLRNKSEDEIYDLCKKVLKLKPFQRLYGIEQDMYKIGG